MSVVGVSWGKIGWWQSPWELRLMDARRKKLPAQNQMHDGKGSDLPQLTHLPVDCESKLEDADFLFRLRSASGPV